MTLGKVSLQLLCICAVMASSNLYGMLKPSSLDPVSQVLRFHFQEAEQAAANEQKNKKQEPCAGNGSASKEQVITFLFTSAQRKARKLALDEPGRPQLTRDALDKLNAG